MAIRETTAGAGALAVLTAVLLGAGCSSPAPDGASPNKSQTSGAEQPGADARRPIRVAMSAAFVSEKGTGVYDKIAHYLSDKTGQPCEFVTGLSYSTIDEMLKTGAVDVAFVCGLPYVLDQERPQPATELLVAPVMSAPRYQGKPKYYSDLIVRADSPVKTVQDLRGGRFVYNDELSNSGFNMPRFRLLELKETKGFFSQVLRSGSHEESIRMVAEGAADASYVDSLVLDYDRTKGVGHASKVRVVESLGPAGICPVVVSRRVPADLKAQLKRVLLGMHENADGRAILREALVDRFADVSDANYDDIRGMKREALAAGFPVIK
jgi:phosphonate transport system substrate-binding protein